MLYVVVRDVCRLSKEFLKDREKSEIEKKVPQFVTLQYKWANRLMVISTPGAWL